MFNSLRLLYTVTDYWYFTYLGKGSHLIFVNRSEGGIDKLASNIKRAVRFCNLEDNLREIRSRKKAIDYTAYKSLHHFKTNYHFILNFICARYFFCNE